MKPLVILFVFIQVMCSNTHAQRQSLITIGKTSIPVDSLYFTDSLTNGRLISTASFTINLTDGEQYATVLNVLQASLLKNAPVDLNLWYGNHENSVQRNYTAAVTTEFGFPYLSGEDRNGAATVSVKLRSNSVKTNEKAGPIVYNPKDRPKILPKSTYKATFGDLPARRISKINFNKTASGNWVALEIIFADIEEWSTWFNNGAKKMDASIFLTGPDMRSNEMEIKLLGAEAVSMKRFFIKSEERVQRFTVLFKVNNILLVDVQ